MDRLHGLMEISWIHTIHEGKLRNYFRWFCSASLTIAISPPYSVGIGVIFTNLAIVPWWMGMIIWLRHGATWDINLYSWDVINKN